MDLEANFHSIVRKLDNDRTYAEGLWEEIKTAYSQKGRYYHHLGHIEYMLTKAQEVKTLIQDWDVLTFSIYYHDIVYNVKRKDNEEKSAEIGLLAALNTGLGVKGARLCKSQILATKKHEFSTEPDTNHLTDTDLCILGESPKVYQKYTVDIRKEYSTYPGFLYKKGRKKVLKHFLAMDRIFKTDYFYDQLESSARENLQAEIERL